MKHILRLTLALAVFLQGNSLQAQRTYIVDAAGGIGTHFKDLRAALLVTQHGDTIIMRKGIYEGAVTQLGLTILGEPGTTIRGFVRPMRVHSLPAGRRFVMKGIEIFATGSGAGPGLALSSNTGSVHLEKIVIRPFFSSSPADQALSIRSCKLVTLNGCHFVGQPALDCESSTVLVSACSFLGTDAQFNTVPVLSSPGLRAKNATLQISTSAFGGGKESSSFSGPQFASPALDLLNSDVLLAGPCLCVAGHAAKPTPGMEAVWVRNSRVRWSTDIQLRPSGTAQAYSVGTSGRVSVEATPSLLAAGTKPSTQMTCNVFGNLNDLAFTLAGVPSAPSQLPFGTLWLDPASAILLDSATLSSRYHQFSFMLPNQPQTHGQPIVIQSYLIRATLGPQLSTAACVILD